jgi:hypothetical protein
MAGAMEYELAGETSESLGHVPNEAESHRIREHLEVLLADPLFHNSKRLPAFLRYVVREALLGKVDGQIKERTLGVDVFGRAPDYDTNADPVVRMTAGEVRKKLAQYYYANHHADVHIEVPLGSYMPRFRYSPRAETVAVIPAEESAVAAVQVLPREPVVERVAKAPLRGWVVWLAVAVCVVLAVVAGWRVWGRTSPVESFWGGFSSPSKQVLIVLPALARVAQAEPSYHFEAESVAIEDAEVATRISDALGFGKGEGKGKLKSHLVLATAANLSDLRNSPFVLIGALDNVWTMRLSQSLPFAFDRSEDRRYGRIIDRKNPAMAWTEDFSVPNAQIPQDYGIVARFTDPTTEQPTLLVAGISAEGTLAAGEAVTTPGYLEMLLKAAGHPANGFEAVIETKVINGESGPPRIVAMRTW